MKHAQTLRPLGRYDRTAVVGCLNCSRTWEIPRGQIATFALPDDCANDTIDGEVVSDDELGG